MSISNITIDRLISLFIDASTGLFITQGYVGTYCGACPLEDYDKKPTYLTLANPDTGLMIQVIIGHQDYLFVLNCASHEDKHHISAEGGKARWVEEIFFDMGFLENEFNWNEDLDHWWHGCVKKDILPMTSEELRV
jgi:hypothetical protein